MLFDLGLTHDAALLLLHLLVVEAKESPLLLQVGWQHLVPNLPASRQLSPLLKEEIEGDHPSLTWAMSNSLAAATCLTISLGFLATHLPANRLTMLSSKLERYHLGKTVL